MSTAGSAMPSIPSQSVSVPRVNVRPARGNWNPPTSSLSGHISDFETVEVVKTVDVVEDLMTEDQ